MIKSMTGFAAVTEETDSATIAVTLRSVNHRHLDTQFRLPASMAALEPRLRACLQPIVSRGRVEVAVAVQPRQAPLPVVEVNDALVSRVAEALADVRARGLVEGALTPGDVLRIPQAIVLREAMDPEVGAGVEEAVARTVARAVRDLDGMRVEEGRLLRRELDGRCDGLARLIDRVGAAAHEGEEDLRRRLSARLAEVAPEGTDPVLLAQEVVRFVARSDISEELVRFRAHLTHWATLADGPEACGRKLDFLVQEMNREVNTMGSKAEGTSVPELIVHAKAELEKLREQVQNVE